MSRYNRSCLSGFVQSIGMIMAVIISWNLNQSVGWAIFHAFLGWAYVIYRFFAGM